MKRQSIVAKRSWASAVLWGLLGGCGHGPPAHSPPAFSRNLDLEGLERAVRFREPSVTVVMSLANQYLASRRFSDGQATFCARAAELPERPLFLALCGLFQARLAPEVPLLRRVAWVNDALGKLDRAALTDGLSRYLRGLVAAELPPRFDRSKQATADLEWMLTQTGAFPSGLRRGAYLGLARLYAGAGQPERSRQMQDHAGGAPDGDAPVLLTNFAITARAGLRFTEPALTEPAPGVFVARGFDFADIAFVPVEGGVVAIDAGTSVANAQAALAAFRKQNTSPLRAVIVTHAHWDHVGGLNAYAGPGVEVIAQAGFAAELAKINAIHVPFHFFFGAATVDNLAVAPTRTIAHRETVTIGGQAFVLHPIRSGETEDALLVSLPDRGVVFVGDAFMPYFGAPFVAEGSPEGFFETVALLRTLHPRLLIHGHAPLTDAFTVDVVEPLAAALQVVHAACLAGLAQGQTLSETLGLNLLPPDLEPHPAAVFPFLLMRENFIKRIYQQRTGYWKADGEGLETFTNGEWGAAIDLVGGGDPAALARAATTLADRGDFGLSLRIAEAGLAVHRGEASLTAVRKRALAGLRFKYQFSPFKFIVYSEMAREELPALR